MKNTKEMREERAETLKRAQAVLDAADKEDRNLTEDEVAEIDALRTEAESRRTEIEARDALEAEKIDARMNEREDAMPEGDGGFRNLGEFLYNVRFNPTDKRLVRDAWVGQTQDGAGGADGGFLVPVQYQTAILTVNPQEAIVRPRATVIPADATSPDATLKMPALDYSENMYGGVTVSWIAEQDDKPQTEFDLRQITLTPFEVAGYIPVSDKLLRNSAAASILIEKLLRGAILAEEDKRFILSGGGTTKPTGVIGHGGTVEIPRDAANTISYGDIVDMYASIRGNSPVWVASPTVLPQLMQMVTPGLAGNLVWQPNAIVGSPGSLLGLPLLRNERNPVLGQAGDLMLCDFSSYLIKDGSGLAVAASEHVYFLKNTTVVKAYRFVDGSPWLNAPLTLEDGVTEASPFVILDDSIESPAD